MGIQPGSKNSSIRVQQPTVARTPPSPGMKKLLDEAKKLPGQVKAMNAAIKPAAASAAKPGSPAKPGKK